MLPVAFLQNLDLPLSSYQITALILFAAAFMTLIFGFIRQRKNFISLMPSILFIAFSALVLLVPRPYCFGLMVLAGLSWIAGLFFKLPDEVFSNEGKKSSSYLSWIYLALVLAFVTVALLYKLGDSKLHGWEESVARQIYSDLHKADSLPAYIGQRFVWSVGAMNSSNDSLFYGLTTNLLMELFSASQWTLRLASVGFTFLNMGLIYLLGRRFFNPFIASAAAILLGLNTGVLYYGRYGSSLAGTFLALLLAFGFTFLFLEKKKPSWGIIIGCGLSLYFATLQYAVARLFVLVLIAILTLATWIDRKKVDKRRFYGVATILAFALIILLFQGATGGISYFAYGNNEHVFLLMEKQHHVKEYLGDSVRPEDLTLSQKLYITTEMIKNNLPHYGWLFCPTRSYEPGRNLNPINSPLYYFPLYPFLLWGVAHALSRPRCRILSSLIACIILCSIPVLLTNVLFIWRVLLFAIPLTLLIAWGLWKASRILFYTGVPSIILHLLGVLLILNVIFYNTRSLKVLNHCPSYTIAKAALAEADQMREPVTFFLNIPPSEQGWLALNLLRQHQQNHNLQHTFVKNDPLLSKVRDSSKKPTRISQNHLNRIMKYIPSEGTLILAPGEKFTMLQEKLMEQGVATTIRGQQKEQMLLIRRNAQPSETTKQ